MSKRLTQEEFEKKIYNKYGEKYKVISNYQTVNTEVKLLCNKCGYKFSRKPSHLYCSNVVCPQCERSKSSIGVIKGVNDIWSIAPEVAELLTDKNDGYTNRLHSDKKLMFTCCDCNKSFPCTASNVYYRGLSCPYCSDGIKYPNKFIRNILKLLNIDFIPEYKISNYDYFYDVQFNYNNNQYVIEMDGGYGHGKCPTLTHSIEEQIKIDKEKDRIAHENGYIIIRIDCDYSDVSDRKNYIINNIKKSILNDMFNITSDIYDLADLKSQHSNIILFGKLWNNNIHDYETIMNELNIKSKSTIRRYGKLCVNLGIIDCTYKQLLNILKNNSLDIKMPHKGQPIRCIQTKECFCSIRYAEQKLGICHIERFFSGKYSYCGKLNNGTKLTWEKISRQEYKNYLLKNE